MGAGKERAGVWGCAMQHRGQCANDSSEHGVGKLRGRCLKSVVNRGRAWVFHWPRLPPLFVCSQALMPSLLASGRGHSPAATAQGGRRVGIRTKATQRNAPHSIGDCRQEPAAWQSAAGPHKNASKHTSTPAPLHPPVMLMSCRSCCRELFSACSAAISPRRRCACSFFLQAGGRAGGR